VSIVSQEDNKWLDLGHAPICEVLFIPEVNKPDQFCVRFAIIKWVFPHHDLPSIAQIWCSQVINRNTKKNFFGS